VHHVFGIVGLVIFLGGILLAAPAIGPLVMRGEFLGVPLLLGGINYAIAGIVVMLLAGIVDHLRRVEKAIRERQ
jgi:hypothetical protein